jgi:hypothetical protein
MHEENIVSHIWIMFSKVIGSSTVTHQDSFEAIWHAELHNTVLNAWETFATN